jgi:Methyltransferase domain
VLANRGMETRRALVAIRWKTKWRIRRFWRLEVVKPRFGVELVRDWLIDRRYGGSCAGTYAGRWGSLGYRGTSSAHYVYLRRLFSPENIAVGPEDVLVDIGSGKGRVLNHWLEMGLNNRLIGIEIDERFAGYARDRLGRFDNVEVLCGDAFDLLPQEGSIFYLFSPFTEANVARFKDQLVGRGRPATVVYYFCQYGQLFVDDPKWDTTAVQAKTFHPALVARLRSDAGGAAA